MAFISALEKGMMFKNGKNRRRSAKREAFQQ